MRKNGIHGWGEEYGNLADDIADGKFQSKSTLLDGEYVVELRHVPSETLLTLRDGKWYAKIRGRGEYMEVKNRRRDGEDTLDLLEAL